MQVVALYRHPIKSFPAEPCDSLEITDDGRVAGDRVLGFRFDDAGPPNDVDWRRKTWFASLQHSPALASLRCGYDAQSRRLWISLPGNQEVIEGCIDEPGDRLRIEQKLNEWYASLDATPSAMGRRKLPLRLVGDGTNGRFHDTSAGLTTLHSRESLADLAKATELAEISELRFRSNIAIEGCNSWDEFTWVGRKIRIGDIEFRVRKPVTRCLATHVDPTTAQRNIDVMGTLTKIIGQSEPQFAVSIVAKHPGTVHLGDELTII